MIHLGAYGSPRGTSSICAVGVILLVFSALPRLFAAPQSTLRNPVAESPEGALNFEQHVRPILKAHCFDCHGEGDTPRGGLDLRLVRWMKRGGDSGPALIPGDPEGSPVFEMVHSGKMPKRERKPSAVEVDILERWIRGGAPTLRPEPESLLPGMHITPEERGHWAFQPVRRPRVPALEGDLARRVRNPIDAFVGARLASHDLSFSPDAPPLTMIRRVFLDLWGIPPTPEEVEAFLQDPSPNAYENCVDRLLSSPRYGERWARHWLDIAGYADSDGYTNDDTPRPYAYKYRDYVIRAFNRDLPFDRFILEQLAGDELALLRHPTVEAAAQDPESREWLIATGFLRMAADGTASGGVDPTVARNQVMADTLKIVSSSFLGLTVGCAQCHDHRYDPIPQTDYHRLRAVFEPAFDWKAWRTPSERLISLYTEADRATAARVEEEAAVLAKDKETRQAGFIDEALKKHLDEKFDASLREPLWMAFKTPADQRSEAQKQLLRDHPSANITPGVLYQYNPKAAEELKAIDTRIAEVRKQKPVEDFIAVLTEPPGHQPVTYRFHRGDPTQPKEPIAPGTLSVLLPEGREPLLAPTAEKLPTSGRRLAFARWLVSRDHPLVARVLVNRVWMHHFGRGLVGTPTDFGLQGEHPTHPELLDWLASSFISPHCEDPGQSGVTWRLKSLHRLIVTSTTYRQSAIRTPNRDARDPDNRLYSRGSIQRLDAEALRDAWLAVAGSLCERAFGPSVPVREDTAGQVVVGIDKKEGDNKMPVEVPMGDEEFRRSVYVEVRRSRPLAFLNAFDAPVIEVNCERRASSTVAPQSLMLMNSAFALQQAALFAARLKREAGDGREARIERAWRLAFGRSPSLREQELTLAFLTRQEATFAAVASSPSQAVQDSKDNKGAASGPPDSELITPEDRAFRSLCQSLLGSNEFLYLD